MCAPPLLSAVAIRVCQRDCSRRCAGGGGGRHAIIKYHHIPRYIRTACVRIRLCAHVVSYIIPTAALQVYISYMYIYIYILSHGPRTLFLCDYLPCTPADDHHRIIRFCIFQSRLYVVCLIYAVVQTSRSHI